MYGSLTLVVPLRPTLDLDAVRSRRPLCVWFRRISGKVRICADRPLADRCRERLRPERVVNELEVRRTIDLYRSMLASEMNERRKKMLAELLMQEQLKLDAIQMSHRSSQDN